MNVLAQQLARINPWRTMLIYMSVLALYGIYALGNPGGTLAILAVAVPFGVGLDYALHKIGGSRPKFGAFPQSGLISSLIVSVLMPVGINPLIVLAAVALAVGSKHYLRFGGEHIFNPAAFGVSATILLAGHPPGWWPDAYAWLAIVLGAANIWRVKKHWQVLGFGLVYAVLLAVFFKARFSTIESMPWFFMLFMLPEPMTSRSGRNRELAFGATVALFAVLTFYIPQLAPASLMLGLLAGNLSRFILGHHLQAQK